MTSSNDGLEPNGLICFTNCLLPQEDGSLVERDLWIDENRGVILDAQLSFFERRERPGKIIDLGGNILSPGFLDIQINGAYDFDFSVYPPPEVDVHAHSHEALEGDEAHNLNAAADTAYRAGLDRVTRRIVETGVTSLLPTVITQEKSLYPKLLNLLSPFTPNGPASDTSPFPVAQGAHLLGWHAEGPFLQPLKRGAHSQPFLLSAVKGVESMEDVYGENNLAYLEDWEAIVGANSAVGGIAECGVRIITVAPEIAGVMPCIDELSKRGLIISIGHSTAPSTTATLAITHGARLITHLFNAMPQLHHRDPSIIGLLGASPYVDAETGRSVGEGVHASLDIDITAAKHDESAQGAAIAEAIAEPMTPTITMTENPKAVTLPEVKPLTDQNPLVIPPPRKAPILGKVVPSRTASFRRPKVQRTKSLGMLHLESGQVADMAFDRPFYGLIVDGMHSHPNSVRLAYSAHKEGCILITDAMKMLDPHMRDGIYEWRDGRKLYKQGVKLTVEGTDTLAGSVVTMDTCVRNFSLFTGCSLGDAIKCATYNPAKCLNIEHRKGTLRPGADADLVVLDRQGRVVSTWVLGREVYKRG